MTQDGKWGCSRELWATCAFQLCGGNPSCLHRSGGVRDTRMLLPQCRNEREPTRGDSTPQGGGQRPMGP